MGTRKGRAPARQSARASRRTSTPVVPVEEEEPEVEAPDAEEQASSEVEEAEGEEEEGAEEEEEEEGEEDDNNVQDSQQADDEEQSNPPTPMPVAPVPRRRGRPPRVRPEGWDTPTLDDASDSATPRRRGRGGWRGGRGRGRGSRTTQQMTRVPVDKEGNTMEVVKDEVLVPEDPEGETKVDKDGVLQDGREYRVRTFTLVGREKRLYMLSTEPARCTGFRDSYLFFTRHMTLFKIIIGDEEKRDLIERDLIPHSYKGRAIGVVTARSVFREFGARIVVGGRKVVDDYKVAEARERGDVEGELVDPFDRLPEKGQEYNRNQYVAWHGASSVYHDKPNAPLQNGRPVLGKRKTPITSANWMLEHAREASRFNAALAAERKLVNHGVYEPHTNRMFFPRAMQPTHARWEQVTPVDDQDTAFSARPSKRLKVNGVDGASAADENAHHLVNGTSRETARATVAFPAVPSVVARNFLVIDSYFQSPPSASWPEPGASAFTDVEHAQFELPRPGLPEVPPEQDDTDDMLDQAAAAVAESTTNGDDNSRANNRDNGDDDWRAALRAARALQRAHWAGCWGGEARDGGRAALRIGVGPT